MIPLHRFLDFLFPPRCGFCGVLIPEGQLCGECEGTLPRLPEGANPFWIGDYRCVSPFFYRRAVRAGIRDYKFHGKSGRAALFAAYLAETVAEHLGGEFDSVTYVPIHPLRRWKRGYDQSQLLAQELCRIWQSSCETALKKVKNTRPQSSLVSSFARRTNAQGCYRAQGQVAGKRFLLVDDVVTTGSTLTAAADALMAAGAASVVCAAFAGYPRGQGGMYPEKTGEYPKKWTESACKNFVGRI